MLWSLATFVVLGVAWLEAVEANVGGGAFVCAEHDEMMMVKFLDFFYRRGFHLASGDTLCTLQSDELHFTISLHAMNNIW